MNYQERVSTRADVRALYEKVIADPTIRCYRGYTDTKSYGWDAVQDDYIKKSGEVFFENPSYNAFCEIEAQPLPAEETADVLCEDGEEDAVIEEAEMAKRPGEGREAADGPAFAEAELARALAERDEARRALLELRDALALVARLAGVQ